MEYPIRFSFEKHLWYCGQYVFELGNESDHSLLWKEAGQNDWLVDFSYDRETNTILVNGKYGWQPMFIEEQLASFEVHTWHTINYTGWLGCWHFNGLRFYFNTNYAHETFAEYLNGLEVGERQRAIVTRNQRGDLWLRVANLYLPLDSMELISCQN